MLCPSILSWLGPNNLVHAKYFSTSPLQFWTYRRTWHGEPSDLDDNYLPTEQPTPLLSAMSWPVTLLRI